MSNEELVVEIQAGAVGRMGELWEQIEKLVKWKAARVISALEGRGGVEFDDLVQCGYLAMVAAVDTYDPTGGTFSTWLMYHLKTAFAEATGYRTQSGKNEPLNNFVSLDMPLSDDADSGTLADVVADPKGQHWRISLENTVWQKQLKAALEDALLEIPEQYRDVLRLRYWEDMTLEDIGELRGISRERVRQMESKGIRILRQPKTASQLYAFCDFDFYGGTGLGAFRQSGMSIQERYLMIEQERRQRLRREQEKDRKLRERELAESREQYRQWLAMQKR